MCTEWETATREGEEYHEYTLNIQPIETHIEYIVAREKFRESKNAYTKEKKTATSVHEMNVDISTRAANAHNTRNASVYSLFCTNRTELQAFLSLSAYLFRSACVLNGWYKINVSDLQSILSNLFRIHAILIRLNGFSPFFDNIPNSGFKHRHLKARLPATKYDQAVANDSDAYDWNDQFRL